MSDRLVYSADIGRINSAGFPHGWGKVSLDFCPIFFSLLLVAFAESEIVVEVPT
jgi:hypothetical protein